MTTRSEQLAQEFKKANNEFIALIERLDERQWRARCAAEGWTVAVAAYHIGEDAPLLVDFAQMVANGKPLPDFTVDAVDSMNGEQAARNANCTKQQVLELLRRNGAEAASALRGLTDAQLDNAVLLPDYHPIRVLDGLQERVSAQDMIERVLIGHFREHGASIMAAAFPALSATPTLQTAGLAQEP